MGRGRPRLGLGTRFALLIAALLTAAFIASALFSITEQNRLLREDLLENGRLLGRFVALVSPEAILAHDFETLNDYAREINDHQDIVYGVLLDERGEPLTAHLDPAKPLVARALESADRNNTRALLNQLKHDPELIAMNFAIRHGGRTLGSLELGLDTARLAAEERAAWRDHLLRSGVLVALLAVGIGVIFRGAVLSKVNRLMEGVERVREGVLDRPVAVTSRDELGELTQVFNQMIVSLAEHREMLTNINSDLERRVADRTADLDRELGERRRAEAKLERTVAHTTELLEASSEAYLDLDPQWRINYVNRAAEQLFEVERRAVIDQEVWQALPALEGVCRDAFEKARNDGEQLRSERYIAPLGKWLEVRAYPGEGGMWTFFKEITAAKLADAALAENEERLRALLTASPDPILFKDAHGRWAEANPAALEVFGLEGTNYRGLTDSEVAELAPLEMRDILHARAAKDRRAWNEGGVVREEERFSDARGLPRAFDTIKVPLFFDSGAPKGLVVLAREISAP